MELPWITFIFGTLRTILKLHRPWWHPYHPGLELRGTIQEVRFAAGHWTSVHRLPLHPLVFLIASRFIYSHDLPTISSLHPHPPEKYRKIKSNPKIVLNNGSIVLAVTKNWTKHDHSCIVLLWQPPFKKKKKLKSLIWINLKSSTICWEFPGRSILYMFVPFPIAHGS